MVTSVAVPACCRERQHSLFARLNGFLLGNKERKKRWINRFPPPAHPALMENTWVYSLWCVADIFCLASLCTWSSAVFRLSTVDSESINPPVWFFFLTICVGVILEKRFKIGKKKMAGFVRIGKSAESVFLGKFFIPIWQTDWLCEAGANCMCMCVGRGKAQGSWERQRKRAERERERGVMKESFRNIKRGTFPLSYHLDVVSGTGSANVFFPRLTPPSLSTPS